MNKIFNWTFGAFFRTLGRVFGFLVVCLLLLLIGSKIGIKLPDWLFLKVEAVSTVGWGNDLGLGEANIWYDCSGSNTCTTQKDLVKLTDPTINRTYLVGDDTVTIATNGTSLMYRYNVAKDYLYSVQIGVCSNKSLNSLLNAGNYDIYPGLGGNGGSNVTKYSYAKNWGTASTYPFSYDREVGSNCYLISKFIVPSEDTQNIYLRLKSSSSITGFTPAFIGISVEPIGIYNASLESAIESAIDNSGFATAESVEEVNTAVVEVQEEVQELNNSIDETNNNIMSDDSPNVSGMTDLAGYLPAGPLDSVLNLPLSILNSLNNRLSSSCTPLSLTLPFVNLALNIPCLSTIINQINGLRELWESIGILLGALIMYKYLGYLYNWVDDVTSLRHNRTRLFGAKSDADNWAGVE